MMTLVAHLCLILGVGFSVLGAIGLLRLPDFYTRSHAATKPDTLGLILSTIGLALLNGPDVTGAKLLLIAVFVAIANPAAAHALGRSALHRGLVPWTRRESR